MSRFPHQARSVAGNIAAQAGAAASLGPAEAARVSPALFERQESPFITESRVLAREYPRLRTRFPEIDVIQDLMRHALKLEGELGPRTERRVATAKEKLERLTDTQVSGVFHSVVDQIGDRFSFFPSYGRHSLKEIVKFGPAFETCGHLVILPGHPNWALIEREHRGSTVAAFSSRYGHIWMRHPWPSNREMLRTLLENGTFPSDVSTFHHEMVHSGQVRTKLPNLSLQGIVPKVVVGGALVGAVAMLDPVTSSWLIPSVAVAGFVGVIVQRVRISGILARLNERRYFEELHAYLSEQHFLGGYDRGFFDGALDAKLARDVQERYRVGGHTATISAESAAVAERGVRRLIWLRTPESELSSAIAEARLDHRANTCPRIDLELKRQGSMLGIDPATDDSERVFGYLRRLRFFLQIHSSLRIREETSKAINLAE